MPRCIFRLLFPPHMPGPFYSRHFCSSKLPLQHYSYLEISGTKWLGTYSQIPMPRCCWHSYEGTEVPSSPVIIKRLSAGRQLRKVPLAEGTLCVLLHFIHFSTKGQEEAWAFGSDSGEGVTGQSGAFSKNWAAGWWLFPKGSLKIAFLFFLVGKFSWKWISCYFHFFPYPSAQISFSLFYLGFPHHTHCWPAYSSGICHVLTDLTRVN